MTSGAVDMPTASRAQDPGGPDLRRGLVLGAGEVHVDALPQGDAQLRWPVCRASLPQARGCRGGRRRGTGRRTPAGSPPGGGTPMKILMWSVMSIRSPGLPVQVHAAGGVGDYQGVAAQQAEHPDGVGDLLIGVALVVVHPALHNSHLLALQGAEHQLALVAGGGGDLEMGDVLVRHGDGVFHHVAQVAQAGAQDQGHLGGTEVRQLGQDGCRRSGGIGQRYSS